MLPNLSCGLCRPPQATRRRDREQCGASCQTPSSKPRTARELLRDHAGDADHRKPAIVQLLGLHGREVGRALGLEAQRVEAKVAWRVLRANLPQAREDVALAIA